MRSLALFGLLVLASAGCNNATRPDASEHSPSASASVAPRPPPPTANASAAASASAHADKPPASPCTPAGKLARPRRAPSVSLLPDGTVLIAGGKEHDDGGFVADVERFDPRTKTLKPAAPLHEARAGAGAAVAGDGRVVVASGRATPSVEVYDPKKDQWTKVGALAGAVIDPAVVTLASGDVLIAGGDMMWKGAYLDDVYVFEVKTSKLRPVSKLPDQHLGKYVFRQADGKVAFLGRNPNQLELGPVWTGADAAYDPASNRLVTGPLTDPTALALRPYVAGPEQPSVSAILRPAKGDAPLLAGASIDARHKGGPWYGVVALHPGGKPPSIVVTMPQYKWGNPFEWGAVMIDDHTVVVVADSDIMMCPLG